MPRPSARVQRMVAVGAYTPGVMGGMDELILVLDPGEVTGWSLWNLPTDEAIYRLDYGLIKGGLPGFIDWLVEHRHYLAEAIVVCEKFVAERGGEVLLPLQIEGALICQQRMLALPEVVWQLRSRKRNLGERRRRDELLREHGLWISPAEARSDPAILHEDARDVNDTALHALIFAKDFEHQPSLRKFFGPAA